MWYQRSRYRWINEGDKNTKFYHSKTIKRRRRNKILMLRDFGGRWMENDKEIENTMLHFYKSLFMEESQNKNRMATISSFPVLEEDMVNRFGLDINLDGIKHAIFAIGATKAPRMDGFPPLLPRELEHCW